MPPKKLSPWHFIWILVLILLVCAGAVFVGDVDPWLDSRLSRYQSLIAGLLAVFAGSLAFLGAVTAAAASIDGADRMANATREATSEANRENERRQATELQRRTDDQRASSNAMVAALALQLAYATERFGEAAGYMFDNITLHRAEYDKQREINILNIHQPEFLNARDELSGTLTWCRDVLRSIAPTSQAILGVQMQNAMMALALARPSLREMQEILKHPVDEAMTSFRIFERIKNDMAAASNVLRAIFNARGDVSDPAVDRARRLNEPDV